ncbi:MFS transporter [Streptomyces sp. HC44]|uniref:MFS transporter n=1 Tax=Streptomyces scabichelini TaxID=2711217 RepID=A0A6G4UXJ7_9ACTN|nr:MFS transporter [Streptomyces scabichelini]NGO06498.1 MFS transporter [Streptomyces scabichelini]
MTTPPTTTATTTAATTVRTEPPSKGRRLLALALITSALGLDIGGLNVMNAALPAIGDRFHLADSTLQWAMTSYALGFAGFLLFGGRAADVLGRRFVFMIGVAVFAAAALAGALAPGMEVLIAARAVQGIGAALSGPAALALLAEVFPPGRERDHALGVYAAVGAAAGSGGFVLGGLLTDWFGWRSVLLVLAVLGAAVLAAAPAGLPRGRRQSQPLDLTGAAAVTGGLVLTVFGVTRLSQEGWSDPAALTALAVAFVLLAAFVAWERRTRLPLLPLTLFRSAPVRAGTLAAFLNHTAAVGLQFFAPLYFQDMLGYSPVASGFAVLPLSLAVFVTANFFTGRLLGRWGLKPLLVTGLVLLGAGSALWMTTTEHSPYWLTMLPGLLVMGVGTGLTFPAMTAAALTGVAPEQHGVAGAVNVTAQQIGASVGVAALVAASTAASGTLAGYHLAYLAAAIACGIAAAAVAASRLRTS